MRRLTRDQAKRYALAAQGFTEGRPEGKVDVRHYRKVLDRIGVVQLDSVNVFSRTHFLPFFSRLGVYDRNHLDRWIWSSGEVFEYWAHMASVVPTPTHHLFRWRMERAGVWRGLQKILDKKPDYLERILDQVRERGPIQTTAMNIATGELLHDTRRRHAGANVLAFFKWIDLHVERHIDVHVVLDNLSAHKSEPVREWLAHPKQLRSSALDDYFERPLSVEAVGRFKPAAEVYLYAVAELKGAADQA